MPAKNAERGAESSPAKGPAKGPGKGAKHAPELQLNMAVVSGVCSAPPEVRVLESGTRIASLSVRAPARRPNPGSRSSGPNGADSVSTARRASSAEAGERATSVPVTVWDPPAWVEALSPGEAVLVVGQVRRRFYSRPGGVGSRVDLEAVSIARAGDRRRVDAALRRASNLLDDLR